MASYFMVAGGSIASGKFVKANSSDYATVVQCTSNADQPLGIAITSGDTGSNILVAGVGETCRLSSGASGWSTSHLLMPGASGEGVEWTSGNIPAAISLTAASANDSELVKVIAPGEVANVGGVAPLASPTFTGTVTTAALAIGDGSNVVLGTSTGTKIGTSTSQKLGFFNATPVVQQSGNTLTALSNLGLVTAPTLSESNVTNLTTDLAAKAPLASPTFTGTVTLPTTVVTTDPSTIALGTSTGLKIGTAANQKLGFFDAAPVVQQAGTAGMTAAGTDAAIVNAILTALRNLGLCT